MTILDRFRLDGRVAIVTGASSGLGVAFAQGLCQAGASVVLAARRVDKLAATAEALRCDGAEAIPIATDVAEPAGCQAVTDAAMAEFGRVDILVNNAGVGTSHPASRETPDEFRRVIDVNLSGCYWMAQCCGRIMKPGSSIVNISSVVGLRPQPIPQAAYGSSKAALFGLTRDLANQWTSRRGIRVNCIAPGYFDTEMSEGYDNGYIDKQLTRVPMGRQGDPLEVAATLVWLVSDAGGYMTGQTIVVDGGYCIG